MEKKSQKTHSLIVTKFLPCQLFATGMSNVYTVCLEEQFKVQTSLRKRNNFKRNWTKTWNFCRNFQKKWQSLSKNFLAALSEPKFSCPSVYFAKSILLRHIFTFENLLDFNKKKHKSARSEDFFGKSLFLSHLMAKLRPSSELRLVKKLPFDSKNWRKAQFFLFDRGKTMEKFLQRK